MADNKIRMPSGMAGITRYDDASSNFKLSPGSVVVLSIVVVLIIVMLHLFGSKLLGIS